MKTIILLLLSISAYGQITFYLPLKTNHFDTDELYRYAEDQGGNNGLVISYEYKSVIAAIGSITNSYGKSSGVLLLGYIKSLKNVDLSLSLGLASGYDKMYEIDRESVDIDFFRRNNFVPVGLFSTRVKVYKNLGLQVNISPLYVNYGIYVKL